jgi:hypothetical protein
MEGAAAAFQTGQAVSTADLTLSEQPGVGPVLLRVTRRDRVRSRLRAAELDRRLAAGADPDQDVALALHARRLLDPGARRKLARSLRRSVAMSRTRLTPASPRPPIPSHVADCAALVEALADRVGSCDVVAPRGVAAVRVLLTEGGGPLYASRGRGALAGALEAALDALEPPELSD